MASTSSSKRASTSHTESVPTSPTRRASAPNKEAVREQTPLRRSSTSAQDARKSQAGTNSLSKNESSWKKIRRVSTGLNVTKTIKRRNSYQSGDAVAIQRDEGESPKAQESPRRRTFMAELLTDKNALERDASYVDAYKLRQVYSKTRKSMHAEDADGQPSPRRKSFEDTAHAIRKSVAKTRNEISATEALMTISYTKKCERMARQHFLELTRTSKDDDGVMDFGTLTELLGVITSDIQDVENARPEVDFANLKGRVTKAQLEAQNLQKAKDDVLRYTRELHSYLEIGPLEKHKEEVMHKLTAAQHACSMLTRCTWDMRSCFYKCGMVDEPTGEDRDFITGIVQEIRSLPEMELQSVKKACLYDATDDNAVQEVTLLNITRLGMRLDKPAILKAVAELRRVIWEAEVDSEFNNVMTKHQDMLEALETAMSDVRKKVKRGSKDFSAVQRGSGVELQPLTLGLPTDYTQSLDGPRRSFHEAEGMNENQQIIQHQPHTDRIAIVNTGLATARSSSKESTKASIGKTPKVSDQDSRRNDVPFKERRLKRRVTTGMLHIPMKDMITGDLRIDYASEWSLRDKLVIDLLLGDTSIGSKVRLEAENASAASAASSRRTFPVEPRDPESRALFAVSMNQTLDEQTTERRIIRNARRTATSHLAGRGYMSNGGISNSPSGSRPPSKPKCQPRASAALTAQQSIFPQLPAAAARDGSRRPTMNREDTSTSAGLFPQGLSPLRRADVRLPSLRGSMLVRPSTCAITQDIVEKDHMKQRWQYVRMQRQRACGRTAASVAWLQDADVSCAEKRPVSSRHLPDIRGRRSKTESGQVGSVILLANRLVLPSRRANTAFRRTRDRWNMLS